MLRLFREKPVFGPRQAQVLAQGGTFVFPTEDPAPLQFGHGLFDEVEYRLDLIPNPGNPDSVFFDRSPIPKSLGF